MRAIELLITQSRRETENEEFTDTTGISDEEFIEFANRAQSRIQTGISLLFPDLFLEEKEIDAVINQEDYAIPLDAFLGSRVELVEYSPDGTQSGYYNLDKGSKKERLSGVSSTPSFYIRRSGFILLQPAPQQAGTIRITYQKSLPKIDKRRAQVSAVTLTSNSITSLTLDTTQEIDDVALLEENYITVIDKNGVIKMKEIPITAISTSSGAVTVEAGFTFESGETIAVGDYVVRGKEASTHSQLPDVCQPFLIAYMNWKALFRDSSNDSVEQNQELKELMNEILASYGDPDGDVNRVPILTGDYLSSDD